jgi:hypothetical protein
VTGGVFWSPVEPLEPASGAFFRGSARDEFLTGGEFPEPDEDPLPCFSVETVDPLVDPLARSASFFLFMASRTFFLFCSRVTGAVVVVDTGAGGGATCSLAGAVLARLDWSPELPLAVVEAWDDEAELVREDENTFPPFSPAGRKSGFTCMVGLVGAVTVAVTGQLGSRAWTCLSMAASFFFTMKGFHVCRSLYRDILVLGSV